MKLIKVDFHKNLELYPDSAIYYKKSDPMKTRKTISLFIVIFIFIQSGCKKATAPTISTVAPSEFLISSAKCGGIISADGGEPIMAKGVCWSILSPTTIDDNVTIDGNGSGSFTSELKNLLPNTFYFVRAYATNSVGTSYGEEKKFKTIDFPSANVSNIKITSNNSILCKFVTVGDGGSPFSEYGICWDINQDPQIESNHIVVSSDETTWPNIAISGLKNNTTYYIRGYAKNKGGTGYGSVLTFKTFNWEIGSVTDIDNNTYKTIKIGPQVWMQENLKVTHFRNGSPIPNITDKTIWEFQTAGAMCWHNNDEAAYKNKSGGLYNWYAVVDERILCPAGWHTPLSSEWLSLFNYLGGYKIAYSKIRDYSWTKDATNESGFSAILCGYRYSHGSSSGSTMEFSEGKAWWWSSNEPTNWPGDAYATHLFFDLEFNFYAPKNSGLSVRCLKD